MRIALASDHAGYPLKEQIKAVLQADDLTDFGTHSTDAADLPDFVHRGKIIGSALALEIVRVWMSTDFRADEPKYTARVDKVVQIDETYLHRVH